MSFLADPFLILALWALLAAVNLFRRRPARKRDWVLLATPSGVLFAISTPAIGYLAMGSLEWRYPPRDDRPKDCQAIVVLSGYAYLPDTIRREAELGDDTLRRCVYAGELYRQGKPVPVLATGGKLDPEKPEFTLAVLMQDFLRTQGIAESDLLAETKSANTYENAKASAALLRSRGISKVALVTDGSHLWRAERCFRTQGIDVVPRGCGYRATRFRWSISTFLPSIHAVKGVETAWHEWLGMAWYKVSGKIH